MNTADYILLLDDKEEEDMRGEYGKDLMMMSHEYLMLPMEDIGEKLTDMIQCRNQKKTSMYQVRLLSIKGESVNLQFDSYILRDETFSLNADEPYRRGVSGCRDKYHYLTFSLVSKEKFEIPKNSLEYLDI